MKIHVLLDVEHVGRMKIRYSGGNSIPTKEFGHIEDSNPGIRSILGRTQKKSWLFVDATLVLQISIFRGFLV